MSNLLATPVTHRLAPHTVFQLVITITSSAEIELTRGEEIIPKKDGLKNPPFIGLDLHPILFPIMYKLSDLGYFWIGELHAPHALAMLSHTQGMNGPMGLVKE